MSEAGMSEGQRGFFEAREIGKGFAGLTVLAGVSLSLGAGEMVAVVGASGTGKTTLLHILGALDQPTSGQVLYRGQDLLAKNPEELARFRNQVIGFVFQFHHLLPEFNARENVMLPGFIAGQNPKELEDYADYLLRKVGVLDRALHKVGELSGGEQQRVALARALVMKPEILLADEPTGNLDPKTGRLVFELIRELSDNFSLATVMVTHNLELAGRMHRCLTLRDGGLHEDALPAKFVEPAAGH